MTSLVLVRGLNTRVLNTVCECTLSKIREWYVKKKFKFFGKALHHLHVICMQHVNTTIPHDMYIMYVYVPYIPYILLFIIYYNCYGEKNSLLGHRNKEAPICPKDFFGGKERPPNCHF